MKRAVIGGFISIIGSIWTLAVVLLAVNNLAAEWSTPPGRFLTTISELHMTPFFLIAIVFVFLGITLMVIEYFRKET